MARNNHRQPQPAQRHPQTPANPVDQFLTNRYLSQHAQEGAPAPKSPHLAEHLRNTSANTPGTNPGEK